LFIGLASVVAVEIFARNVLGLGDPPLSMSHPTVEYMFRPDRTHERFGNTVKYNAYSMRSDAFPPAEPTSDEIRILLLGDSVINGGNLTDQSELASERLKRALAEQLDRPVLVGNVSAGSWGPGNLKAYVDLYGLFDADLVVLVLSSHDANDVRQFKRVVGHHPGFPAETPSSALEEGLTRYLPRYLPAIPWSDKDDESGSDAGADRADDVEGWRANWEPPDSALPALRDLIEKVQAEKIPLLLVQNPSRKETNGDWREGHRQIKQVAEELQIPILQTRSGFRSAMEEGRNPYRDNLHPNALGQKVLADQLLPRVMDLLDAPRAEKGDIQLFRKEECSECH